MPPKYHIAASLGVLLALTLSSCNSHTVEVSANTESPWKPRVINTTDLGADPDDKQSLVRQLVMANEYDLEGLIVSTGCWKKMQDSTIMLDRIIDAYEQSYPNLKKHAQEFPEPSYLRSITAMGQLGYGMSDVGDSKDSIGSNMIIKAVDKDDTRPVWVTCWGGCNTAAQALHTVKQTRSDSELKKFIDKLRIYDVLGQDDAGTWIAKTFPDLVYIRATGIVYGWQPTDEWLDEHIQSHGPLGAVYPDRKWMSEGDTPAFLHVYPSGLNDPSLVSQGGWGGRFTEDKVKAIRGMKCMEGEDEGYDPYLMYGDAGEGAVSINRWQQAIENDFEARMDWSITDKFENANHHPIAILNGNTGRGVLKLRVKPGADVELDGRGSSDPDGDTTRLSWSVYQEASSYKGDVSFEDKTSELTSVSVPQDASGQTIHIILQVSDDGQPSLTRYRRLILEVL